VNRFIILPQTYRKQNTKPSINYVSFGQETNKTALTTPVASASKLYFIVLLTGNISVSIFPAFFIIYAKEF
jgi:hypothetical protein